MSLKLLLLRCGGLGKGGRVDARQSPFATSEFLNGPGFGWIALRDQGGIPQIWSCLAIAALTWLVVIGDLKPIARTAQYLAPLMTLAYLTAGLIVIAVNVERLVPALREIFTYAFTPASAAGGFAGATVMMALRYGAARGAYSNEAGTGSVAIMHATARSVVSGGHCSSAQSR